MLDENFHSVVVVIKIKHNINYIKHILLCLHMMPAVLGHMTESLRYY